MRRVKIHETRETGHFEVGEDEHPFVEAMLDRFVVGPGIDRHLLAAIEHGSKVGDGFFSFHAEGLSGPHRKTFWKHFGCTEHHLFSRFRQI